MDEDIYFADVMKMLVSMIFIATFIYVFCQLNGAVTTNADHICIDRAWVEPHRATSNYYAVSSGEVYSLNGVEVYGSIEPGHCYKVGWIKLFDGTKRIAEVQRDDEKP
jgi:hypothetical protein